MCPYSSSPCRLADGMPRSPGGGFSPGSVRNGGGSGSGSNGGGSSGGSGDGSQSKLVEDLPWEYDIFEPEASVPPWELDVMLMDVDSPVLHGSISMMLGHGYLSTRLSNDSFSWPLRGIVHGKNSRLMVCAVTSLSPEKAKANEVDMELIYVHYLVDTGAPYSYVSEEAVKALSTKKFYYDHYDTIPVLIHGIPMEVHVSPSKSHFKDVCLLGADFMKAIQGEIHAFYGGKKSFTIVKGSSISLSNASLPA